jgi:hypothetical protein
MNVFVSDDQTIGESEATVFAMIQNSPVSAAVTLTNTGTNTANYRFQEQVGANWNDLDVFGTDLNNTLSPNQVKIVLVSSNYPQVRLVANASGGTVFDFGVTRFFDRLSGGSIPMLSL